MSDIQNPKILYLKFSLFVGIGVLSGVLLLLRDSRATTVLLLATCIWAFCRAYYFCFYVIQNYVDDQYRFAGLLDFAKYVLRRR